MLDVKSLTIKFEDDETSPVDDISFCMEEGALLGLVGESGSGKTMTALSIAGLLREAAKATGEIIFDGQNLLSLTGAQMRQIQGVKISMVFQEPMSSLNPLRRVGWQVEESMKIHTDATKKERKDAVFNAMREVELENPESLYRKFPHELSGGMRQRIMLAAAMLLRPKLLICDEPTTALDAATGVQIVELLKKLNKESGVGVLFISHDLMIVKRLCDRVIIMNGGKIVESGETLQIFENPQDDYTKKLLASRPKGRRTREGSNSGNL
jgi:ABC-type glutathione transport system ATPase component